MPKFRRVTGLFRAAIPDGPDADYTPELEALNGQIEFIPRYRGGVIAYPHLDPPEFVRPEPIQAVLQDGRVMTQVTDGEETVIQPVELMVSDDDEAAQSWQWEAVFRDIRVGRWGDEITISPIRFTVPDEHGPLDLTEVVGEKSGGTITVKGPRGEGLTDIRAEGGELIVEWGADKRLVIPVPDAVPGPKGDKGGPGPTGPPGTVDLIGGSATITVSKQAGTSVKVGDVLVHYESGWRDISAAAQSRTTGRLTIRRVGNVVSLVGDDVKFSSSGTFTIPGIIPQGFRPDSTVNALAVQLGGTDAYRVGMSTAGNFSVFSYTTGSWIRWEFVWLTSNPVPTELPGVAT